MNTKIQSLIAVALLSATASFADTTTTAPVSAGNQSVAQESPSTWQTLNEKAVLALWAQHHGPSLSGFDARNQPDDVTATGGGPQYTEGVVTAGWKVNKDTMIGAIAHFNLFFDGGPSGPQYDANGQGGSHGLDMQMLDPALVIRHTLIHDNGNGLSMNGYLYTYLGFTQRSAHDLRATEDLMSISPTLNLNWDIPGTKVSLGAYGYVRGYIPRGGAADPRLYKLNFCPNANWQFSKTVGANVWVDLVQATHKQSQNGLFNMTEPNADIEPGINWDISPKFALNPMLNIYPANPTLATTSLFVTVVGRLF